MINKYILEWSQGVWDDIVFSDDSYVVTGSESEKVYNRQQSH